MVILVFTSTICSRGLAGADQGFLEMKRGFICIKVCGVRFADFISFFLNITRK